MEADGGLALWNQAADESIVRSSTIVRSFVDRSFVVLLYPTVLYCSTP